MCFQEGIMNAYYKCQYKNVQKMENKEHQCLIEKEAIGDGD